MKGPRQMRDTGHRSSAPLHPGEGTGPGKGHVLDSYGGPTLAVSDNANLRADGFRAEDRPVLNVSPALQGSGRNAQEVQPQPAVGRGGLTGRGGVNTRQTP